MNLKNIAALFLLTSTTALAQVTDPVLMRVNGKEVTRSEFEYAFNKNNTNLAGEGQSVEEYLPMYVDFKLKVAEAESLSLDTLSSFKEEFKRDRNLMAENYLVDTCFINDEAYKIYAKDSATIGQDGFIIVCDENGMILSDREGHEGEHISIFGDASALNIQPYERIYGEIYGKPRTKNQ